MNVLAYSPDGQMIATGGDDGKVGRALGLLISFDSTHIIMGWN